MAEPVAAVAILKRLYKKHYPKERTALAAAVPMPEQEITCRIPGILCDNICDAQKYLLENRQHPENMAQFHDSRILQPLGPTTTFDIPVSGDVVLEIRFSNMKRVKPAEEPTITIANRTLPVVDGRVRFTHVREDRMTITIVGDEVSVDALPIFVMYCNPVNVTTNFFGFPDVIFGMLDAEPRRIMSYTRKMFWAPRGLPVVEVGVNWLEKPI